VFLERRTEHEKAGFCYFDTAHCGKCENVCPQHLKIRDYLEGVSEIFDKKRS
jgi:predicted aldo/keto reductase-like oxidoreductase